MTEFEFIFVLYGLLLGLSLVELLSGLGRALEMRFASEDNGKRFEIGYLTPLLATFVILDLLSFWAFAWPLRTILTVTTTTLMGVMAFACAYFLAARLVFPSEPERFSDLDVHYFRVRRPVLGMLIALVGVQWAFLISIDSIRENLFTPLAVGMTLLLVALMAAAMAVKSERWSIAILLALIARYLVIYLV